ncbi:MAG: hypothetical protein EAY66_07735 [Sphingobacteriales bacterium]|nr:MAG: hypothetical protein EAY66_07735 [Sphingobacteriales bacterium]
MQNPKKRESSAFLSNPDGRLKEQLIRAKKEAERQKQNLETPVEGVYTEKNGNENTQYEGLKNEPKIDGDNDPPQKEK